VTLHVSENNFWKTYYSGSIFIVKYDVLKTHKSLGEIQTAFYFLTLLKVHP